MYQGTTCRVVHCGQLSEAFELLTGGKEGCQLTPIMFLMLIDWIAREITNGRRMGIQLTMWDHLEDLDFADDIALLSHRFQQIQEKTTRLETIAARTGLRIKGTKTMMRIKNENENGVSLMSGPTEEVSEFTYLRSVVSKTGGTEEDVKLKLGRARVAFRMKDKVRTSNVYSRRTKLRLFNSNVKQLLLYGSETWRSAKALTNNVHVFINRSLRRILAIRWYDKMSNVELWKATDQESAEVLVKKKEMDMDRTHVKETKRQHRKKSSPVQPSRTKE